MTQTHDISWHADRVPVSERFDDPFYSLQDGLAEARHVFLAGNDLPARLRPGFRIAELGFGTGLNLIATALVWAERGPETEAAPLRYTSFEAYPLTGAAIRQALGAFTEAAPYAQVIAEGLEMGGGRIDLPGIAAEVIRGDARVTVPAWTGHADAWYLDGFSPAKNPELWEPDLMAAVADHTAPGGSFATYSAAGSVRRALAAAGFDVARVPGYGRKRHMCVGRLR
jgi:tRNA U34 5-methylaminomethyl-2-thiouridine-forming methyltransferase MnmC